MGRVGSVWNLWFWFVVALLAAAVRNNLMGGGVL